MNDQTKNLYAYRLMTLGDLQIVTVSQSKNIIDHNKEARYLTFQPDNHKNEVVIIKEVLEEVNVIGAKIQDLDAINKLLILTVTINNKEDDQQLDHLEYMLTPNDNPYNQESYKIYVIEEDNS